MLRSSVSSLVSQIYTSFNATILNAPFANQAVYCATKFAQVGFAQSLDKELRPGGIKVGVICPGGVKTEFAIGTGRTEDSVAQSTMLEATDVAEAVLLACTQAPGSRIIEIQMRTMSESL